LVLATLPLPAQTQPNPPAPEQLPPLKTSITVTERVSSETPAPVTALERQAVEERPGVNLDDRLRQVPGFTLFRRTSSLVAHPTTQGISLRGIGSNGASRTLMLWDGVPVNDPFGGWVYWTQFSADEIERIEISEGASTSVFGDRALGGVLALFSREPERWRLLAGYALGNEDQQEASAGFTNLWTHWAVSANARAYTTDGYFIVPADIRGAVDRPANVRFAAGDARVDYLGGADRLYLKFDALAEERGNGTALQTNSTGLGRLSFHYSREMTHDGVSLVAYRIQDQFHGTFSAIAPSRNFERITSTQTVPADGTGAAAFWEHHASGFESVAGADVERDHGVSTDYLRPAGERVGGGTLLEHGIFAQTSFRAGPAQLFAGARHDFTGLGGTFFSPSGGIVYGRRRLRARGSVYRSFRSPTLNELYRQFRTGNTVTQANPNLVPETLFGAEAGADFTGEAVHFSLTVYRDAMSDLISNVTLSATPNLIIRQRQNAASSLARGVQFRSEGRLGPLRGELNYLFVDSRFDYGARVPQVARHQGSAQLVWLHNGTLLSAGVRAYSSQFEDERNLPSMLMPGFASVQFAAQQRLKSNLSATLAFENLLDREYIVGFTPNPNIGSPRLWRAGLRWDGQVH
jgi:outer membrane cobalamin receptor